MTEDRLKEAMLICAPTEWGGALRGSHEGVCDECGRTVWVSADGREFLAEQKATTVCGPCSISSLQALDGKSGLTPQQLYEIDASRTGEEGGQD